MVHGAVTISTSVFRRNSAGLNAGGALFIDAAAASAAVNDCTFLGNTARASDGAIFVNHGSANVSGSRFLPPGHEDSCYLYGNAIEGINAPYRCPSARALAGHFSVDADT